MLSMRLFLINCTKSAKIEPALVAAINGTVPSADFKLAWSHPILDKYGMSLWKNLPDD
jgi:hypothetical protein